MGVINRAGLPIESATNGIYFSGTGRGWGVGKVVPGEVTTTAEMIKAVGLDWQVEQVNLGDVTPYGGASSFKMNVRSDTQDCLGVVGKDWTSPSNIEAFNFVDTLLDNGDAKWLGGGALKGGQTVFGIAQLDRPIVLGGDDDETILPLLFLRNGWNGGTSLSVEIIPMRLICTNGMTMPTGQSRAWKVRHTPGIALRVAEARKTLDLSIAYLGSFEMEMEKLLATPFTERKFKRLTERVLPYPVKGEGESDEERKARERKERRADEARTAFTEVWNTSPDIQRHRDNAYGAYNAITEYFDWHQHRAATSQEKRFVKALDDAYGLKAKATEHLLQVA